MNPSILFITKTIHILSAVFFLGFGLASFFYKSVALRTKSPNIVAWCDRHVVLADWLFTVPSCVLLPATGALMVHLYGMPWTTSWVDIGIAGYTIAVLTWLVAAHLQIVMQKLAERAVDGGLPLSPAYHTAFRRWRWLGLPSFIATMTALWAMVSKR
ncbi:MAG: DUF2269 domain-containing protein [Polyangiaceae bacterium]|nr:DUF2269 domain-containing protein [Polyangiaceae bacterium]